MILKRCTYSRSRRGPIPDWRLWAGMDLREFGGQRSGRQSESTNFWGVPRPTSDLTRPGPIRAHELSQMVGRWLAVRARKRWCFHCGLGFGRSARDTAISNRFETHISANPRSGPFEAIRGQGLLRQSRDKALSAFQQTNANMILSQILTIRLQRC